MVKKLLLTILLTVTINGIALHECTATYYTLTGTTASGRETRRGIMATSPDHLGQTALVYERDGLNVGDLLGIYECLDTGNGKDGAIKKGYVIDIWTTPDDIPPTQKVWVQFVDAKG